MRQLEITFEAGVRERFPEFADCLKASAYGCGRAFKVIAADLDMSASELSRKLAQNPNDPVNFPAQRLPELIRATNLDPIIWLVEEFLEGAADKRERAKAELAAMLPRIAALLEKVA
jgi:hypothetical protein